MKAMYREYSVLSLLLAGIGSVSAIGGLFTCLLANPSSARAEYKVVPIDSANVGSISGSVRIASGEAQQETFPVSRDREVCGSGTRTVDWVRTTQDHLLDVVVFVDDVGAGKPFSERIETATLNQKGCRFAPLIQVLHDGGTLILRNLDPIMHNAQAFEIIHSARRKIINVIQEAGAEPLTMQIRSTRGNVVKIECNAHDFMHSWLFIARNPYYSEVDERGDFIISDLPEGQYRVRAWHPRLGYRETSVLISAGQNVQIVFEF